MKPISRFAIILFVLTLIASCSGDDAKGVWIQGWKQTAAMKINRAGTAVVVADGFMYVIGGVDGRVFLDTVEFARIKDDGSLGQWQFAASMNEPRGFTSAVVKDGSIYVVGGGNGPNGQNLLRSVERARLLPGGGLGPWTQEQNEMVVPRRCSKVVVEGDTLFSFGGFGGALLDTVERARFLEDGSVGNWELEDLTMTVPRYTSGVNLLGKRSYVVGGHHQTQGGGIQSVEWSAIDKGRHTGWQQTSAMLDDRFELATVDHGNTVYALGGISRGEYHDSIESSTLTENGLSPWQYNTPLSSARASMSAVVYKDWIYIIGGTNRSGYFNSVEYASFDKNGQIGFFGTAQEQQQYQQAQTARKEEKSQLPNNGIAQEVIHAAGYTYIRVFNPDRGEIWVAGNHMPGLKVNDRVAFSEGVAMSNYYSKSLQRSFPSILFVGTVEKQ